MSTAKFRKMNKKLHPGRGAAFGKGGLGRGIRGISFYNGSDRQTLKRID